jgi:hypothetical protein
MDHLVEVPNNWVEIFDVEFIQEDGKEQEFHPTVKGLTQSHRWTDTPQHKTLFFYFVKTV